jgi:hypothetical protein
VLKIVAAFFFFLKRLLLLKVSELVEMRTTDGYHVIVGESFWGCEDWPWMQLFRLPFQSWLPVIELQAPRGDRHPNVRSRAELEFFERRDRMTDSDYDDGSVSISRMFSLHFFSLWNTIALRIGLLFEKKLTDTITMNTPINLLASLLVLTIANRWWWASSFAPTPPFTRHASSRPAPTRTIDLVNDVRLCSMPPGESYIVILGDDDDGEGEEEEEDEENDEDEADEVDSAPSSSNGKNAINLAMKEKDAAEALGDAIR